MQSSTPGGNSNFGLNFGLSNKALLDALAKISQSASIFGTALSRAQAQLRVQMVVPPGRKQTLSSNFGVVMQATSQRPAPPVTALGLPGTRAVNLNAGTSSPAGFLGLYEQGYRFIVSVDGKVIDHVIAFNEAEGWLDAIDYESAQNPDVISQAAYTGELPKKRHEGLVRVNVLWSAIPREPLDRAVEECYRMAVQYLKEQAGV